MLLGAVVELRVLPLILCCIVRLFVKRLQLSDCIQRLLVDQVVQGVDWVEVELPGVPWILMVDLPV